MKETILNTDLKADYSKYIYFCSCDKATGNLMIVRAERSKRSKGIKSKQGIPALK